MPASGKTRVIFTDLVNREEWEQEYDIADLEDLFEVADALGINQASAGGVEGESDSRGSTDTIEKGWSNAFDSRVSKPIGTTYPITHNILMRLGQLDASLGGCSATLVGRRLVLTAAHCVVNADLSQTNQQYRARRDGSTAPFGNAQTAAYWWDSAYSNNNCHIDYTAANRETCGRYDWALLLLPDNAWSGSPNGTPGWMGYWVPGSTDMEQNAYARNDGYPGCGNSASPSGCTSNRAYGETVGRTSVLFRGPDTSGSLAIFQTGNDTSVGHSGGPIWSDEYPNSTGGPYVLAIFTNQLCGTCTGESGTTLTHPTMVRRITPWVGGFITTQRTSFP